MAKTTATILIPDISGFTEFMTNTELSHSSFAISALINTIIDSVGDEYEISEIEGDAVLMFRRGPAPSKKDVENVCLKIFNAFHYQRSWMQKHTICPCKACLELDRLTLKFVAHHGPVGEIKAGKFTKLSGTDVIVAHRLLKNSVPSNEYLLVSEQLLQQSNETFEGDPMEWVEASDDYNALGKIDYRFALLTEEKSKAPEAETPNADYPADTTLTYFEIPIAANYLDAYMTFMNVPERAEWFDGLQKVEQEMPVAFVGSVHRCTFENHQAIVSPLKMTILSNEISYAESCRIEALGLSLVHDVTFSNTNDNSCLFTGRIFNVDSSPIDENTSAMIAHSFWEMAQSLKEYCEKAVAANQMPNS